MSENLPENLKDAVQRLEELSGRLLVVLEAERQALVSRDLGELQTATGEKADLCAAIDTATAALGHTPLRAQISALPPEHRHALEPAHERLTNLVRRTQECNAVNGKVLHRSQQSVRELMHLMSGMDTGVLYSEQGYTDQGRTRSGAQGTAIAKA